MKIKLLLFLLALTLLLLGCAKQELPQEVPNYNPGNYIVKTIETPAQEQPQENYQTASHIPKEKKSSTSQETKQPTNTTIPPTNITLNTSTTNISINNTIINNTITNTTINTTYTNTTTTNTTTNTTLNNTTNQTNQNNYPWHNNAYTTQFYIGTPGTTGAGAWDMNLLQHYGGVDNPINRTGYYPLGFTPKENPFYYALPYSDFDANGARRTNVFQIPWYIQVNQGTSLVKNRWIEVKHNDKTCYGQWEDCGPVASDHLECDDFAYVFGNAPQAAITATPEGFKPALDVSPAMSDCLGMDAPNDPIFGHSDDYTSWRFIDEQNVPNGPWKEIITTSQVDWN